MKQTFGQKLNTLRKEFGFTQDEVASKLGVTPQAVSKWENDLSCPDIMLLPKLAQLYHISIDELFKLQEAGAPQPEQEGETEHKTEQPAPQAAPKADYDKLFLKVLVNSSCGDDVKVQVPVSVIQALLNVGIQIPVLSDLAGVTLTGIDLDQIFALVADGVIGELAHVETGAGDEVFIVVEEK